MNLQITSFEDYQQKYNNSVTDPEGFWAEVAQNFQWHKSWKKTLEWDFATANTMWFVGGKMNITENVPFALARIFRVTNIRLSPLDAV